MVGARTAAMLIASLAAPFTASASVDAACPPPPSDPGALAPRNVTPGDLARLRDIGAPDSSSLDMPSPLAISPDGRMVAFVLNQGEPTSNRYCRQLMVVDIRSGSAPRVLDQGGELITLSAGVRGLLVPFGLATTVTPAWSPDGRSIGYLRRDQGVTQLWRVSVTGGDAKPVTRSKVDVEQWAWATSDRAVIASRPGQVAERARTAAEGQTGWLYDARFSPSYAAHPQMRGDIPQRFESVDLATGAARDATAGEIARLETGGIGGSAGDLAIVNAVGARARVRSDNRSPLSPGRVHFVDERGRETRCTADQCTDGIVRLFWGKDQKTIVYLRREGWAKSQLAFYRWNPTSDGPKRLSVTNDVLLGCLPHGLRFLCMREASAQPRHIAEIDPDTGGATTIYDPNPEFASLRLGKVERLTWRNNFGLPAWGDLVLPVDRVPGKRLPMVVVQYHSDGFLRGGTGDEYPIFALAARGFAVLSIENPPSVAYAVPNLKTWDDVRRVGMKDWAERRSLLSSILTGVSQVVARGIVDPRKIGITGLSDGASTARFALINSRVFSAAAISSSSLEPKTVMTYGGIAWADFNRASGYPPATENAPAFWKPSSVALNAKDMNVPLLIQASDDEYLLALETFTALRENEKPVEMFVYPNEHHIKWQPAHRLAVYERHIDWFAFWLQGMIDPDPAKAAQYKRWKAMRARLAVSSTGHAASSLP